MAAQSPYAIRGINDLAASGRTNVIQGEKGRVLPMDAWVSVFVNQEAVSGSWQMTIGGTEVVPPGSPGTLQATVGVMPIIPDDVLIVSMGEKGEEIILQYTNGDGAVAREGRFMVFVVPVPTRVALAFLVEQGLSIPAAAALLGST